MPATRAVVGSQLACVAERRFGDGRSCFSVSAGNESQLACVAERPVGDKQSGFSARGASERTRKTDMFKAWCQQQGDNT